METIKLPNTIKKIVFGVGMCLLINYIWQQKCLIEYNYMRQHYNAFQFLSWVKEIQTWWSILRWTRLFLFVLFFVGIIAIVLKKRHSYYVAFLLLAPEGLKAIQMIVPKSFDYSFTPEEFNLGLYSLILIFSAMSSIAFIWLALYSQKLYKHGLIIFSLIMSISLIWASGIGILFSIDSSYFDEKFPTFFILRSFYSDYLQYPLCIIATLLLVIAVYRDAYREITAEELLAN